MKKQPIVHKLKSYLREHKIIHQFIADKIDKERPFVTRKLNGESMETRLLEQIMEAAGIWYQDLVCQGSEADAGLHEEVKSLREEVNLIKEVLPEYLKKSKS